MVTKHHYSHSIMFLHKKRIKKPIANAILYGSVLTLKLLEKFIKADIVIRGGEGIRENPALFVVNHFTRVETILLPYIIRKATNNIPNSLADSSFFKGRLGDYMKTVGALSVDTPDRNDIIIGDLITGRKNWVIFPEGAMIKTKKVIRSKGFSVHYPGREGPIHTGSAYLAILAELYKRDVQHALKNGDEEKIAGYCKRFSMESPDELSPSEMIIIPTNLTYFPIRPGRNIVQSLAAKFVKEIPDRLEEELEIEGNLLFSDVSIHVTFGSPIIVKDFLNQHYFNRIRCLSSIKEYQRRLIRGDDPAGYNLSGISRRLTNHFMDKIYSMVTVNMDHLFSFGLLSLNKKKVTDYSFKSRLFLACEELKRNGMFNLHPVLENLPLELVADEEEKAYDGIEEFTVKERIIEKRNSIYFIDENRLKEKHDFHRIRIENTVRVIANEIDPVNNLRRIIRGKFRKAEKRIKSEMVNYLRKLDLNIFREDYDTHYDKEFAKPEKIGAPFHLNSRGSRVGILICHGYLSAPEEVRILGDYLSQCGYSVYGPRLKGHGTSPYDLQDVKWHDWYDSFNRGYAILRNSCEQVVIGGFSTGGTLALLAAAKKKRGVIGFFTVNAPLQLKSIRSKLVGPIHFWNQLLERFNIEDGGLKYVDHEPENPDINYTKNSINGVRELGLLMDRCRNALGEILIPALIIQEANDPIVDPRSASIILDNIKSRIKELYTFEMNRHGILRHEGCEEVFVRIREFIERIT